MNDCLYGVGVVMLRSG